MFASECRSNHFRDLSSCRACSIRLKSELVGRHHVRMVSTASASWIFCNWMDVYIHMYVPCIKTPRNAMQVTPLIIVPWPFVYCMYYYSWGFSGQEWKRAGRPDQVRRFMY